MSNTELTQVKEESRQLDHMNSRLSDSLFSKDLAPHYMKLAGQLASSELVPKVFRNKPQDLFICWAWGYQVGMSPEQAMQCIAVINGKPCMWGDEMLALVMSHKDFEDIIEEPIMKDDTVFGYTCSVKRKGRKEKVNKFDLNDAKRAGLLAKGGVWNQYPERMLKLRARGFSLRDAFPDALKGIKSREEVEDYIEAEYIIHDKKGTRTEQLKQQLNVNKEVNHVEAVFGEDSGDAYQPPVEESEASEEQPTMDATGEEAAKLHIEIKRLIEETGFDEARLKKALKFYQVEKIEDMDWEAAHHFIIKLTK